MIVTDSEQILFCDIDDTLIMHDTQKYNNLPKVIVLDPYLNVLRELSIHAPHVLLLRERAARGAHIKAMSAGGYKWAEAVINALGLQDCVAECLSKPVAIIDDLPVEAALGKTMYLDPNSKWKSEEFLTVPTDSDIIQLEFDLTGDRNGN